MNTFGSKFRVSIFGESHGVGIGVILDGVPAGIALSEDDFMNDLSRRRSGGIGTTPRKEGDVPTILSGVFNGYTTGAPLAITFVNENTISKDYRNLVVHPRPSHADWVAMQKYDGFTDYRGGGHFSGRITLGVVAAGVVAKKIIHCTFSSEILEIGGCSDSSKFDDVICSAQKAHDSIGGVIECRVDGVDVGMGEPFFDSVESVAAHLLFSIPAIKGVEFGNGFAAARLRGSQNNDAIISNSGETATNNSGGINGGITNGNQIVVRVAVKPTPSISHPQQSLNTESGDVEELVIKGRHDACIAMRAPVVVESAMAIALAQFVK